MYGLRDPQGLDRAICAALTRAEPRIVTYASFPGIGCCANVQVTTLLLQRRLSCNTPNRRSTAAQLTPPGLSRRG